MFSALKSTATTTLEVFVANGRLGCVIRRTLEQAVWGLNPAVVLHDASLHPTRYQL